jgi:hypothetical protein
MPFGSKPLPSPVLVALEVHAIRPVRLVSLDSWQEERRR